MAVKGNIQASRWLDLEREDTELVVVELKRCQEKSVLLHCFYHPNTSPDPILKLNSSLCDNCESACIIKLGDFNLPEIDWTGDQTAPMNNGSRADHNIFWPDRWKLSPTVYPWTYASGRQQTRSTALQRAWSHWKCLIFPSKGWFVSLWPLCCLIWDYTKV